MDGSDFFAAPGAPQQGTALLAGLLRCGRCGGHRMAVHYHTPAAVGGPTHSYACAYEQVTYGTASACQHIAGPGLDRYVTEQVLAAVVPAALEVSLRAAEQAEAERDALDTLWQQRVERAQQAADRARRQYQLAEPEHRLVARHLERQWEQALADLDRLTAEYQRFAESHPGRLTTAERAAIAALAQDLPAVWYAATTTQADRKQLLRILIDHITVAVVGASERVDVTIGWAGGHQTTGQAVRSVARLDQLSYYPRLIARVGELAAAGRTTRQIAEHLNAEGFRPPKRTSRFGLAQVRNLVNQQGIRVQTRRDRPGVLTRLGADQWSVADLAATLQMPTATIYNWIYRGWVTARHAGDGRYWVITADDVELQRLRGLRNRPAGYYTRKRWTDVTAQPMP